MFRRIRVVLWGIKCSIERTIAFERAISGLGKRRMFSFKQLKEGELFKLNPWIDYIAIHSSLSYRETIDLYDRFTTLPWKLTSRRVKLLTKLIVKEAGNGLPGERIDILKLAAKIEGTEKKLIKRNKKGAKK